MKITFIGEGPKKKMKPNKMKEPESKDAIESFQSFQVEKTPTEGFLEMEKHPRGERFLQKDMIQKNPESLPWEAYDDATVYVNRGGEEFHLDGCPLLGENCDSESAASAMGKGRIPCSTCFKVHR